MRTPESEHPALASSVAALSGSVKSCVLAMLAAKRRLRVAPVPPQAADLTPPGSTAVDPGPARARKEALLPVLDSPCISSSSITGHDVIRCRGKSRTIPAVLILEKIRLPSSQGRR